MKKTTLKDRTGQRFGKLVVLSRAENSPSGRVKWLCQCDCGGTRVTAAYKLVSGASKSCGCLNVEHARKIAADRVTHGMSRTPTHGSWFNMRHRCLNPRFTSYYRYGGRGITVCAGLAESPLKLIGVIGERPGRRYSLDRIDSKGNYSCGICKQCAASGWPLNVRWATPAQQSRNTCRNKWIEFNGERRVAKDWANLLRCDRKKVAARGAEYLREVTGL